MNKSKKIKTVYYYILAFLLVFLIIINLFNIIYKKHRNTVLEQQNDQLLVIANVATNYLKTYVDEKNLEIQNMFTLKELGNDPVQIERKVEEVIKLYWNQSPIYLDYMRYFTMEELKTVKITGLSHEALNDYLKQSLKSNELIVGPFVQVNSNNMGIYLFKGIFNEYGKFGMLVSRVNLAMVFHATISNILLGQEGYLTLSDIDETFSYYGNKEGLFFPSKDSDVDTDQTYLKGYSYTDMGNLNLLISARLPFHEIEKPIQITFYLLCAISLGLLIMFFIFTIVLNRYEKKELAYSMELKLQEQMHQGNRNEVLGLFSRKVAHDYNNLLTPITIYCDLLKEDLTDVSHLEYVHEIQQSTEQCTQLAKELLAFGRKTPVSSSAIRYNSTETLKDSIKRIQLLLPDKVSLKSVLPSQAIYLKGQPLEFVQIIYNLCINSIQAMETVNRSNKLIKIHYRLDADQAILTISDTGDGIPKNIQSKIFTTQFTTKQEGKGNGLGLAIVSGIVEKYNGTINFSSQPGKGTEFIIRFPISKDT